MENFINTLNQIQSIAKEIVVNELKNWGRKCEVKKVWFAPITTSIYYNEEHTLTFTVHIHNIDDDDSWESEIRIPEAVLEAKDTTYIPGEYFYQISD